MPWELYRGLPARFVVQVDKVPRSRADPSVSGPHGTRQNHYELDAALMAAHKLQGGVGWSVEHGWVVLDFDSALADDALSAWAQSILARMPRTLVEISPSGRGLHAFYRLDTAAAKLIKERTKTVFMPDSGKLELLRPGFFSTITDKIFAGFAAPIATLTLSDALALFRVVKGLEVANPDAGAYRAEISAATQETALAWLSALGTDLESGTWNDVAFRAVWWLAANESDPDKVESTVFGAHNLCRCKGDQWANRGRELKSMLARAVRHAAKLSRQNLLYVDEDYQHTDRGRAEYLATMYPDELAYVDRKTWLRWTGLLWADAGLTEASHRLAEQDTALLNKAMLERPEPAAQKVTRRRLRERNAVRGISNLETAARGSHARNGEEFALPADMLNCLNGVVDLRTGLLIPHSPNLGAMGCCNYPVLAGPTPVFDRFLADFTCADSALAEYILRVAGYSLTGENSMEKAFFYHGEGNNGKSTFFNLMIDLAGKFTAPIYNGHGLQKAPSNTTPYVQTLSSNALVKRVNAADTKNSDLINIRYARLAVVSEFPGAQVDEERFKSLVSGDEQTGQRYHVQDKVSFRPTCKLWIQSNHAPKMDASYQGITRKTALIPCFADFTGHEDRFMLAKLRLEAPHILHKLIGYAKLWFELGPPPEPTSMVEEKDDWEEDNNDIVRFCEERMIRAADAETPCALIHEEYEAWCRAHGFKGMVHRPNQLLRKIRRHLGTAVVKKVRVDGKPQSCLVGWDVGDDLKIVNARGKADDGRQYPSF